MVLFYLQEITKFTLFVDISRLMKSGMFINKLIYFHSSCGGYLYSGQPFPHGVCTRSIWRLAMPPALCGKGRTSWHPVLSLLFCANGTLCAKPVS